MPLPIKPTMAPEQNPRSSSDDVDAPSNILWVGNLGPDVSDADLMACFGKYGALDSITTYSSRSFAFIYFRALEDAKAAREALQGAVILGSPLKIEFARPAKPGRQIWVGAIASSVTKEHVEDEFRRFGKLEEFRFFRDRNSAIIHYLKLEDAIAAVKSMNGKRLGGEQLRVDYLRSQPSKRENWPDSRDSREGQFNSRKNIGPPNSTWKQSSTQPMGTRRADGTPSNVLWIGYPPSVQIDEQTLHNAMILFGEIERIKSFPSRHYSFVEFRSVEEARRAKEGLQGRLFNDPRIQIMFSSSEFAPGSLDMFGHPRPMGPNGFHGAPLQSGMHGPNLLMMPFGTQGLDPRNAGPESLNDFTNPLAPTWRRLASPTSGMVTSAPGMRPPVRPMWDAYDGNPFQREAKRSRIDGPLSTDSQGTDIYGPGNVLVHRSPLLTRGSSMDHPPVGEQQSVPDIDYIWRGIIAKGGSPVCNARCVPVGKGIDSQLPEIVNCSARTGLDMLAKHHAEASGFDIVYFLPDSEDDFVTYTEFLRYLGMKSRAGVAKLDDGTTLFLVPPSDFLYKVLNVAGPERLYGVVLKMPQQHHQQQRPVAQLPVQQYVDRPPLSSTPQTEYGLASQKDDHLQMDYNRYLHEDAIIRSGSTKPFIAPSDDSQPLLSGPAEGSVGNRADSAQTGVSLTPELIATLAALIPANVQSAGSTGSQLPMNSSSRTGLPQGWRQEEQTSHLTQQMGHPVNSQTPIMSQFPAFASAGHVSEHPTQAIFAASQVQDPSLTMQQPAAIPVGPTNTFSGAHQGTQYTVSAAADPSYQFDASQNAQMGGIAALFRPPVTQQPKPATVASTGNMSQQQMGIGLAADKVNPEFPNQVQQLQSALSASAQGQQENEADKNQRYHSTLQFAANLLLQIQQQQQQANSQQIQGPNNQQ